MRRMYVFIGGLTIFVLTIYALVEYKYRVGIYDAARNREDIHGVLFYSAGITPKENTPISFRLYTKDARQLASADFKLNNFGLFSNRDYSLNEDEGEFRIVVIGNEQTASSVADWSWPEPLEDILNADVELTRKGSMKFRVFNLGWPDAGFPHYERCWSGDFLLKNGKQFNPDLVIVNIVESDFFRFPTGARLTFRGKPIQRYRITYKLSHDPSDEVFFLAAGIEAGDSLRNPNLIPARPYGLFASREFMDDAEKVKKLQERLVDDFLYGATGSLDLHPWFLSQYWAKKFDPISLRQFDPLPNAPIDQEQMIDQARKHLRAIVNDHPYVLLTHNANVAEILPSKVEFTMTKQLEKADTDLKIIDMRRYLPLSSDKEEIESWYLTGMREKFSNKGHRVYAQAMAKLIKEDILKRKGRREVPSHSLVN